MSNDLKNIIDSIIKKIEVLENVRDHVIKESRNIMKIIRETILSIHKGRMNEAEEKLKIIQEKVSELIRFVRQYPEIYYSGLVSGILIEYVEVSTLFNIVKYGKYLSPDELNVDYSHYLLGLGDVVGELRRLVIDSLRNGNYELAEKYFKFMEDIYENISTVIAPDALVPGFKSKIDFVRKIVEITRADLLTAKLKISSVKIYEE